jgi:ubiquinone/menaquinone biosynthesis C-methylase UbiE
MTTGYVLDNRSEYAKNRFNELETLLDPVTAHHLRSVPLRHGARVWEVGAGSGSIARHLHRRIKPLRGSVLATDIDLGWADLGPGIVALQHDVERDELPSGPFDLIHARLVVQHLDDPGAALDRLVSVLAPGGYLVVEEFDPIVPYAPDAESEDQVLINRVGDAFTALLAAHAFPKLGRRLHRELGSRLEHVTNHGHVFPSVGGSPGARLMQANVEQCFRRLRAYGPTADDLNTYLLLMNEPSTELILPVFFTAKGKKA